MQNDDSGLDRDVRGFLSVVLGDVVERRLLSGGREGDGPIVNPGEEAQPANAAMSTSPEQAERR